MFTPVGWRRVRSGASEAAVASLEERLGRRLPADCRRFLLEHDGGEPADNAFAIADTDNESGVNEFLSVSQIEAELEGDPQLVAEGLVPVAYAEGGNLVLVRPDDGSVVFWDHEMGGPGGLVQLAPSFSAFYAQLRRFDISDVRLKPGQVRSAWIDPDLLEQ